MSLNNFEIEHEKIENEPKTEVEKKEKNDSLNINAVSYTHLDWSLRHCMD